MTPPAPRIRMGINRVTVHRGAVKQAVRLLRLWGQMQSDEDPWVERIKQSNECALDLTVDLKKVGR